MISAAVLVRKWSAKRARIIRKSFKETSYKKSKRYETESNQRITSIESKCVDEGIINIHMHLYEKKDPESNLFAKSPAILYKNDEDRFSHQTTLKIKTSYLYNVIIEVENTKHKLVYVSLGGKVYNCFKMVEKADENVTVYGFVWSTDEIQVTQRKQRSILPCVFKFQRQKELSVSFSMKFYDKYENNHYTGTPLNCVHLEGSYGKKTMLKSISFD